MAMKRTNFEKRSAQDLSSLQCQYPGKCGNERALKANGQRHWLCAIHRDHQNAMQRARYQKSSKSRKASSKRQKIRDSTNVEGDRGTMLGAPISRSGDAGNAERPTRLEHARDCSARDHTDVATNATESAPLDPPVEGGCHTTPPPASAVHTLPHVSVQVDYTHAQDLPPIHIRVAAASSPSVYIVVQVVPVPSRSQQRFQRLTSPVLRLRGNMTTLTRIAALETRPLRRQQHRRSSPMALHLC
ncbi:hypothetical protein ON010_g12938 [Phytophthora cinnamomi]|nr:hypothetical protein ON010_g12938 [Phytophthora cinnamomi]